MTETLNNNNPFEVYLQTKWVDRPINSQIAVARFMKSLATGEPLDIFVPWGISPQGRIANREDEAFSQIESFSDDLCSLGVKAKVLIMPADVYALEVNNGDYMSTENYCQELSQLAYVYGFTFKPWSQIRSENLNDYQLSLKFLSPEIIAKNYPADTLFKAVETARSRSGFQDESSIRMAALAYIQERIIEARMIDKLYQPIKFSMVSAKKDVFDENLPRVYQVPTNLRFPWLNK